MDRLLSLLLSLFTNIETLQKVFAQLVERVLKDIPDAAGCKARLLSMLQSQTLDDEFKKDPICVLLCIGQVVIDVASHLHGHDHDGHDVDPDAPVIVVGQEDAQIYGDLAVALGCEIPSQGPGSTILFTLILKALEELLKRYLEKLNQE